MRSVVVSSLAVAVGVLAAPPSAIAASYSTQDPATLSSLFTASSCSDATLTTPTITASEYPENWLGTGGWANDTNNILASAEFQALNATIDWSKAPNIDVATGASGAVDSSTYDSASDPNCWFTVTGCTTPKLSGLDDDIYKCLEPETLGVTFDDGPNCTEPILYEYLRSENQVATLFYIGSNVQNWPDRAIEGYNDGHHIAVHTWSHPLLTTLNNSQVLGELYYSRKIIKEVLGITPLYFRPPYGDIDDRVRWIAKQINLTPVVWSLDSKDWEMIPAGDFTSEQVDTIFESWINMTENGTFAKEGAIQLQHELNENTIVKAMQWLPALRSSFKHIVNVATCNNISHPYAETDCDHCTFATFSESKGSSNSSSPSKNSALTNSPGKTLTFVAAFGALVPLAFLIF